MTAIIVPKTDWRDTQLLGVVVGCTGNCLS